MKRQNFFKSIMAITFISIGILLILTNIDVISLEINDAFHYVYPAFFIIFGLKLLFDNIRRVGGSWTSGTFLIIFGSLLLLGRFNMIDFHFSDIWKLWPIILIFIGANIVFSSQKKKRKINLMVDINDDKNREKTQHKKAHVFGIGDHNYSEANWNVEPLNLWNAVGDYHFDFTKAFIPEKNTPISVSGWVGDVRMLIPESIPFKIEAYVKTGEINVYGQTSDGLNRQLNYETPEYQEATRKLTLLVDLKVGSVRVDRV